MDLGKRRPKKDDTSARAYFVREGLEVCLVLGGLAIAEWITRVPLWIWITLPIGKILVSILFYLFFVKRILRQRPRHGLWSLVGRTARTLVPLNPDGQIKISGEIWAARSLSDELIPAGQDVLIREIQGRLLLVEEAKDKIQSL
jgi:membrane-bound ClpP family serine protease